MAPAIRCVHDAGALLGEGPVWVEREQALFWVDIKGCKINWFKPATGACDSVAIPFPVSTLAPRSRGGFVGASARGFVLIDQTLSQVDVVANPEPELPGNRFNDGKVDLRGRFWAGTMDDAEQASTGSLYRFDPSHAWSRLDGGYGIPNGPAFSPDGSLLYHTDSARRTVYRFELASTGELRGKEVLARFGAEHGYPDGMTTDRMGNLLIAFWDGWCIRRISPAGEVIETLALPVQRPTSCAFGGQSLETLFVTSARVGLGQAEFAKQSEAGGLFAIIGAGQGIAAPEFAG